MTVGVQFECEWTQLMETNNIGVEMHQPFLWSSCPDSENYININTISDHAKYTTERDTIFL